MSELMDDGWCFACGKKNPHGLQLSFQETDNGARTAFTVQRWQQGYQGIAHGGIVFALLDEVIAYAIWYKHGLSATAEFSARIHHPCPVGVPLEVEAWVIRRRQRLVECRAAISLGDGEMIAEATGKFMLDREAAPLCADNA